MIGKMRLEQENGVYRAIQEQGVTVDKDELIKALRYDRDQYEKGYINGYRDAVKAVAEDMHNLEQSRDYWKAKAEKLGKKLHKMRKGGRANDE